MNYSSKLIENAVFEVSKLPGIGRKTALRLVLFMLRRESRETQLLANSLSQLVEEIVFCKKCHNISDSEVCGICADPRRDQGTLCVVEDIRDVMAIENTSQFKGVYHVLGGLISPMDGVSPSDLNMESLVEKAMSGEVNEVILAMSVTPEGDTTNFYIYRKLKDAPVQLSTLSRGVSVGDELEYTDELTLGRSILNRIPYENSLKQA
jgi:recombination protein RecR